MEGKHSRITPHPAPLEPKILWQYRDLILLLTRRSILVGYKQTVLGPAWILIQPLLSALVYAWVFGGLVGVDTGEVPEFLFYLTGSALWSFFSGCFTKNALCFRENAQVMGKVWFPRLAVPLSQCFSTLVSLGVQLIPVLLAVMVCCIRGQIAPRWGLCIFLPGAVLQLLALGLGTGLLLSAVTVAYRYLHVLVGFGMQLWMYASPVLYPVGRNAPWPVWLNPVAAPVEGIRLCLLGTGTVTLPGILWSAAVSVLALMLGIRAFSRAEANFVDRI